MTEDRFGESVRDTVSAEHRAALDSAAARLEEEFGGLSAPSDIESALVSSYERLAATGTVSDQLPLSAERFARERLIASAKAEGRPVASGPAVLFVCTHNAGRSQMALGFFTRLVGDQASGWSGGSNPDPVVNPLVVAAMAERGVDIAAEFPKPWTDEFLRAADVVIDMGCGDTDPIVSGHRFEQWPLRDPAGQGIEEVREIRDDIEARVRRLIANLGLPVRD
ncbi:arsenate reductase ArsC [Nocardia sp. NPDC051030]|uniref:arsenate reductase ArsC n=1 Tax=Nocardia sp. NPDC051030 TaxID=3155162 RepID=UPI0034209593